MRARVAILLAAAVAGSVLLPACVLKHSKNAEVFVLEPAAARDAPAPADVPVSVVGVMKVTVPGWIDRPQIVTRSEGSQIVLDEFARWGEPVARAIQRVVAENLAALLPDRRVLQAPFPPAEPVDYRIEIAVTELARRADGQVRLDATWAVLGRRSGILHQRRSSHAVPVAAPGAPGVAAGMNEALLALSHDIAGVLTTLPTPAPEGETKPAAERP
jgi:uncharacterized lipoprotein YmbA